MYITYTPIKPGMLKPWSVRAPMLNAIRRACTVMLNESFRKTTETWEHKVDFVVHPSLKSGEVSASITTEDKIWNWVDGGTRGRTGPGKGAAYTIAVKNKEKNLWLPTTWTAKTKPRAISSSEGERGTSIKGPKEVQHFGIEPRYFSEIIAKESKVWFQGEMQRELNYWAKESGLSVTK